MFKKFPMQTSKKSYQGAVYFFTQIQIIVLFLGQK